ncbi:MAG: integrase arm-type DNA-binding domain-containing protein [Xanthobacteraceae bacterium]
MSLTDITIRTTKPTGSAVKLSDGGGLYLLIQPTGSKLWRLAYRFGGKQKTLALGAYCTAGSKEVTVPLALARERRAEARRLIASGIDPSEARKADKRAEAADGLTFRILGDEWLAKMRREQKADVTIRKAEWLLGMLCGALGERPISAIEPPDLLAALRRIEARGHHETARRARSLASRIFRYGVASGYCPRDPASDLRGALTVPVVTNRAAITDPTEVGALMRAIHCYQGAPITRLALKFLALTFVRPGELRFAEWSEISGTVWSIPGRKMKMRRPHRVPLARQALAVLEELRPLTGDGRLLFPSSISREKPISENTLQVALLRLGYRRGEVSSHGLRSTASTLLNESGLWSPDAIERQLAHADRDAIRGTYHRGEHWHERVKMMAWWADHLDELRERGVVVPMALPGRSSQ